MSHSMPHSPQLLDFTYEQVMSHMIASFHICVNATSRGDAIVDEQIAVRVSHVPYERAM